jgi:hypothetical protein
MGNIVPASRPRISLADLRARLARIGVNLDELWEKYPLVLAAIRGYYLDSMGAKGRNDRGIYDDAITIVTPSVFAAFNGNTDPSKFRKGHGTADATKGMGSLKGNTLHIAHRFGPHRGYPALRQSASLVVIRDGDPPYECIAGPERGFNIHCGGAQGTSSEGCQTIYKPQWPAFYSLAEEEAKRYYGAAWKKKFVPYALLEEAD